MLAKHEIVRRHIVKAIANSEFAEGDYLPPAERLARETKTSVHAVRRAYRTLSDRGILQSRQKTGTRVQRCPALGRALIIRSCDAHTNLLFLDAIEQGLINARFDVDFLPWLFRDGAGFESLRSQATRQAPDTILVTLAQEMVPAAMRPVWEQFAAEFQYRVGFQFEDSARLADSVTVLPDLVVEARLVAEHLLVLGHRCIGVVAGDQRGDGSMADRRACLLEQMLAVTGAQCHPFYYRGRPGDEPLSAFVRRTGCTAWWTISDHQALEHIRLLERAGLRVPEDVSVVGSNDTPWATSGGLPLTTLSLDPAGIAQAMVEAVRAAVIAGGETGKAAPGPRQHVPPILKPRASTIEAGLAPELNHSAANSQ